MIEKKLDLITGYLDKIFSIKHHSKNKFDAIWKYATCIEFIEYFNINPKNILDIGTADSYLFLYLMKIFPNSNFNGIEISKIYLEKMNKLIQHNELNNCNMNYIVGDFLEQKYNENTYDFIYDNCSIIHFEPTSKISYNDGLYKTGKTINKILTNNGIFIITCDYKPNRNTGEFISIEYIIKTLKDSGLKYIEDCSQYIDKSNLNNKEYYKYFEKYKDRINKDINEFGVVFLVFKKNI